MKEVEFKEGEVIWVKQENPERSDFQDRKSNPFKPKEFVKTIYTDGGSKIIETSDRKRYVGAWSFYDQNTGETRGEAQDNATNNQMEMMAVIKAIEYCNDLGVPKDKFIQIVLDSDYVRLGTIFWSKKWERNGWIKTNNEGKLQEIKNLDLWKRIFNLNKDRKIYYEKVSGHSGVEGNEMVDVRCRLLIDDFIKENKIVPVKK